MCDVAVIVITEVLLWSRTKDKYGFDKLFDIAFLMLITYLLSHCFLEDQWSVEVDFVLGTVWKLYGHSTHSAGENYSVSVVKMHVAV